jgi:hypothetical protein
MDKFYLPAEMNFGSASTEVRPQYTQSRAPRDVLADSLL